MKKNIIVAIVALQTIVAMAQVGTWRNHLSYYEPQQAEDAGNYLFVLASNALYQYNRNDQSITTYDKTNGMSDVYITQIAWNNNVKRLIAVYENSNIDIISTTGEIVNLPDFYSKSMTEDKTVNSIYVNGKYAYLSTGFGIVKVNMENVEISETYNLGFKVNYSYIEGSTIYAASQSKGIYSASLSANLLDKSNWQYFKAYVAKTKTIDDETLALIKTLSPGGPKYNYFHYIKFTNNKLYTCGGAFASGMVQTNRPGTVQVLSSNDWQIYEDGISSKTGYDYYDNNCLDVDPSNENHVFVGGRTGVYEFLDGSLKNYFNKDNSPLDGAVDGDKVLGNSYVLVNSLIFDNDGYLWMANSQTKNNFVFKYKDGEFEKMGNQYSTYLKNIVSPYIDSRNYLWMTNNNFEYPSIIKVNMSTNESTVQTTPFNNQDGTSLTIYYIYCIVEDKDNNMWVGTDAGLFYIRSTDVNEDHYTLYQPKVPRNDGTNLADYLLSGITITNIAIDGAGRKWIGTNGQGVYLISADNQEQIANFTKSNSCLLSNSIESIAINKTTGEVFFGTDKGLCSYYSDATNPNEEMTTDNVYAFPNPVTPSYNGMITIVGLSYNSDIKITTANGILVNLGRSNGGTYQWNACNLKGERVASGIYNVLTTKEDGSKGTVCKIAIVN